MAPLLFICSETNQQAPTGIETDVQSLQAVWKETLKVKCPHCGEVHEISVRETYLKGALQDAVAPTRVRARAEALKARGEVHEISVRETYLKGALQDAVAPTRVRARAEALKAAASHIERDYPLGTLRRSRVTKAILKTTTP
jgi:propanediol dehydratase small subunit